MFTFDFNSKMKKLNPHLYVDQSASVPVNKEHFSSGIYFSRPRRAKADHSSASLHFVEAKTQGYLKAKYEGTLDEYVEGVPTPYVPEFDVYDLDTGLLALKGWRTVVLSLVKKGFCSLAQARRIFSSSLGEADYDRLGFEAKLRLAREKASA